MIVKASVRSSGETVSRLIEAIRNRGLNVFGRIDHAAAAREVGLQLAPEEVVIFGNARVGTPLMQADRRIGYELPLRILVWEEKGQVWLGYRDPREFATDYDTQAHKTILEVMAKLLEALATEAGG